MRNRAGLTGPVILICFVKLKPTQYNKHREELSGEHISNTVLLTFLVLEIFQNATMMEPGPDNKRMTQTSPSADFSLPVMSSVPFPLPS